MQLKDYYDILELPPSASGDEIKTAFRRLAHLYHPDKKNNDPYAAAHFAAIKEAYEILSNPVKKEYYLQQRWYAQSMGRKIKEEIINPVVVLKQSLDLNRYVARLDAHRMNRPGLSDYIESILSDSTIEILNAFNEEDVNNEIVRLTLSSARPLPYEMILPIVRRLQKIKQGDGTREKIGQFVRRHQQISYWEKRKVWLILVITLLICLVIFFASSG